MLKNNNKWDETDINAIAEYCVSSGMSASMDLNSKKVFDEYLRSKFETYPTEGTV
jgi:hypothetical protein